MVLGAVPEFELRPSSIQIWESYNTTCRFCEAVIDTNFTYPKLLPRISETAWCKAVSTRALRQSPYLLNIFNHTSFKKLLPKF